MLNHNKELVHPDVIYFHRERNNIDVEVAMQYFNGTSENIFSYTNNINTIEGGSHLTGFQTALTRTINNYTKTMMKNDTPLSGPDVREGLSAVISVKVPDPQFEGQTKTIRNGRSCCAKEAEKSSKSRFLCWLCTGLRRKKSLTEALFAS